VSVLRDEGVLEAADGRQQQALDDALAALAKLPPTSARDDLAALVRFAGERDR
jgi:hypothetical protein